MMQLRDPMIRAHDALHNVSIRQHDAMHMSACVSIRQQTSAYVSIRENTSAYVSIRQQTHLVALQDAGDALGKFSHLFGKVSNICKIYKNAALHHM